MRSYRNAAFLAKIGDLCEIEKSIVDKICQQILTDIQNSTLKTTHVRWPVGIKREEAKSWIEELISIKE